MDAAGKILLAAIGGSITVFLVREILVVNINALVSPLVRAFYAHAIAYGKGLHKPRHPFKCEDCRPKFENLPQ